MLTLIYSSQSASQVHKWVDENGATHYGAKPQGTSSQQVKIAGEVAKPIPKKIEKVAMGLRDALLEDHGDSDQVDCKNAVSNALSGIDTMLEVGLKNHRDGYIVKSTYEKQSAGLREIRNNISLSKCESSSGDELGFYKCMSNSYNHVAQCGQKYNFES